MSQETHYQVRLILPSELPTVRDLDGTVRAATVQELRDRNMVALGHDYYDCAQHVTRDPVTLQIDRIMNPLPGVVISDGAHGARYQRLSSEHAPNVLRAHVFRAVDPATTAHALATADLPPDPTGPAIVAAAQQLADAVPPDPATVCRHHCPIVDVQAGDVVVSSGHPPHRWHGERGPAS